MQDANRQKKGLLQYLSLAPVLAVLSVSVALSTWILIQRVIPDLLLHPMP